MKVEIPKVEKIKDIEKVENIDNNIEKGEKPLPSYKSPPERTRHSQVSVKMDEKSHPSDTSYEEI